MMETLIEYSDAKYPIWNFNKQDSYFQQEIDSLISIIETAPAKCEDLVQNLSPENLNNTYREGSWNVRQLIHHVADIQMVHFFRMKKRLPSRITKMLRLLIWTSG